MLQGLFGPTEKPRHFFSSFFFCGQRKTQRMSKYANIVAANLMAQGAEPCVGKDALWKQMAGTVIQF